MVAWYWAFERFTEVQVSQRRPTGLLEHDWFLILIWVLAGVLIGAYLGLLAGALLRAARADSR